MKKRITDELLSRKEELTKIILEAEKRFRKAPEGQIRITRHRNGFQFYHRTDPTDTSGKYIPLKERKLAVALIQKKYDDQIIRSAGKQVRAIDQFLSQYNPDALKEVYSLMPAIRQENVIPAELPDHEYAKEWLSMGYTAKDFDEAAPEHYTSSGERVRSKSEVMIADALKQSGIPYRYECPLKLGSVRIHPDFTICRLSDREELYWEHLGMMDNAEYCNNALQRIRQYERNGIFPGINLILTMETSGMPINMSVINSMIREYCV